MRARHAVIVVAGLALSVLAAACSSSPRQQDASSVTMAYCGTKAQVRPTIVSVICETDDITARKLAWSAWGKPAATAIGTAVVDLCAFEDCATGSYSTYPIVLVASKIVSCPRHGRAYSRLQYVFVGTSPFQDVPANVSFKNFLAAPGRPKPPRNQTVSLAC
jgi:hypothetical protein